MPLITGKAYLFFLFPFLWFLFKDRKNALLATFLAFATILIADWSSNTLKHFFERSRPCNELEGVRLLVGCGRSFSMPSNHAVNAFAFAIPFYIFLRSRIRYVFVALAALVAFSRIYVGVHYPSDVVAGGVLGSCLAFGIVSFYNWSHKRYESKPCTTLLFVAILAISLFRVYYIQNGPLDLSPDEAHYWEWSRRLDLSYYSKGPMIAHLIFFGTSIFGDTVFGIRMMAVVFSALSSVVLYILGRTLYDEKVGLYSAVVFQIIPLFSAYGVIFTIDSPFIFFWVLSLFLFWKALSGETQISKLKSQMYWSLLGVSVGAGLLTKYTMAFFYLCGFLFLLAFRERRQLLLSVGPYLSFLISLIVFNPVIVWNASHDWLTLRHTAGHAGIAEGFLISGKSFVEFLGSQIGVVTPFVFVLIMIALWRLRKTGNGVFLNWFSLPVLAFFVMKSLQAKVQANWALPGYITGVIAFSAFYLRNSRMSLANSGFAGAKGNEDNGFKIIDRKILAVMAVAMSLMITVIAHYPSILKIPVRLDPTMRLQGWKELGSEVSKTYEQISSQHPVFIFSDSYQVSSELAFYVKGQPVTYCINSGRRMNQYDLWPGIDNLLGYNAIFVRMGDKKIPKKVAAAFDKVEKRIFSAYTKNHVRIRNYTIFICYNFKGMSETKPVTY
ncbi:MAG: glycosyltransferase family 39 protein [Nitrospirota bacterium]